VSRAETHKGVFVLIDGAEHGTVVPVRQMLQLEKGRDMFKNRLALAGLLFLSLAAGAAFAQEGRGTPEQRAACTPDAFRLCASYIPDATNVEACLRQRKLDLSSACRAVFERAAAPASVRTMGSHRSSGAIDEE
jgi:hypothetical protein